MMLQAHRTINLPEEHDGFLGVRRISLTFLERTLENKPYLKAIEMKLYIITNRYAFYRP